MRFLSTRNFKWLWVITLFITQISPATERDTSYYVSKYHLEVEPNFGDSSVRGRVTFYTEIKKDTQVMRFDLMLPLVVDSITSGGRKLAYWQDVRDSSKWELNLEGWNGSDWTVHYQGRPRYATNPPWIGGVVFTQDSMGNPWFAVACQGEGAALWWPCKSVDYEKPRDGVIIDVIHPDTLGAVANGRQVLHQLISPGKMLTRYRVLSPIGLYNVNVAIGNYRYRNNNRYQPRRRGAEPFYISYALLADSAAEHAAYLESWVEPTLDCFGSAFGMYPFAQDGYKIVETPYLGMEHQSDIAYGNGFRPGYQGIDLSGTGVGMDWDFIVVHETAHEWWGNSVTASTKADMWIHEAFASYAEVFFIECIKNRDSAYAYARGVWKNIESDIPVQGKRDDLEGSGDMYWKGSAILHMIRMMMDDDERFREMVKHIYNTYKGQQIEGRVIEEEFLEWTGLPLEGFLDVYLRTTEIPILNINLSGTYLGYTIRGVGEDFYLRYKIWVDGKPRYVELRGTEGELRVPAGTQSVRGDVNYLLDGHINTR